MYYFIVNPNARSGYGLRIWNRLEKYLMLKEIPYRVFLTERPGHASEYADQITRNCQEPRVIVVVGGDGAFNEVLDGLCLSNSITLGGFRYGQRKRDADSIFRRSFLGRGV